MKTVAATLMALLLAACASGPTKYAKPGATPDEFSEAVYRCLQKSSDMDKNTLRNAYGEVKTVKSNVNCEKFNTCMSSKGFNKTPDGDFVIKDFDEISCK